MLSRWIRTWDAAVLRPLLLLLARCGITPNLVTGLSLAAFVASGVAIGWGASFAGAVLLALGGTLDGIDGALARLTGRESPMGSFLDAVTDHLGDFAVYLGILVFALQREMRTAPVLVVFSVFGSLYGSFVRSRAAMLGIDVRDVGWCTRCERVLILLVGMGSGLVEGALWVLAVATNLNAAQRLARVLAGNGAGARDQ